MINLRAVLLTLSISFIFLSCTKSDDPGTNTTSNPTVPQDTCKVTRIVYTPQLGGGSYGYIACDITYTNNNISQLTYPGNGKIVFTYDSLNNVKRKVYYFNGNPQVMESHTYTGSWLDPPPWPQYINSVDSNYFSGFFQPTGSTVFRYNGIPNSNVVTTITSTNPNVDFNNVSFTWVNGDPVAFKFIEPNTSPVNVDSIYYDTTRINKFNQLFPKFMIQGLGNDGFLFDGYSKYMLYHFISKHMVTKVTTTGSPYYKLTGNFTYTYNAKGLVKETKLDGITILTFSYTCD